MTPKRKCTPFFGFLTSLLLGGFVDELGTRDKAECYAYNWYYFILLLANKRKNLYGGDGLVQNHYLYTYYRNKIIIFDSYIF